MKHYISDDTAIWIMCSVCGAFVTDSTAFLDPSVRPLHCGCDRYKPIVVMIPIHALAIWDEVLICSGS